MPGKSLSPYRGVTLRNGKYAVQLKDKSGKYRHVGTFSDEIVAAVAHDYWAWQWQGWTASLNFADEQFAPLWAKHKEEILNPPSGRGKAPGKSGCVGVQWCKRTQVWRASFNYKGRHVTVPGSYFSVEAAKKARDEARARFFEEVKA